VDGTARRYDAREITHCFEPCAWEVAMSTALAVALCLLPSLPAEAPQPAATAEQIARWVEQLGDKDFDKRQEASKRLWEAGEPAEKPLEAAAKGDDAEVRRRATQILDKFRWGIYPDTPKRVGELIGRYQAADGPAKTELVRQLFDEGVPGCRALAKIATAESDAKLRAQVLGLLASNLPRLMPVALVDNKFDLIERLLDIGVQTDDLAKMNLSHYCAYWMFRGKLDERIKELSEKKDRMPLESELLAYLHRAKGDLRTAQAVAEKANLTELTDRLLFELGDWKALAKRDLATSDPVEKLGYRAAYCRLAGDPARCEDALREFRKLVKPVPPAERSIYPFYLAKALFLNDRPDEAIRVLQDGGEYAMAFDILCTQFKYPEAFGLVEKARREKHRELPLLEIFEARQRYALGEKGKALALFAGLAAAIMPGNDVFWFEDLIDAEYRVGLKDQAFEHAAKVLLVSADGDRRWRLFSKLFPGRGEHADTWWEILHQRTPTAGVADEMKQLRDLFEGKLSPNEVAALIEEAQGLVKNVKADQMARRWLALADTAHAAKLEKVERACLEQGDSAAGLLRLGDLLAENKEWSGAAKAYRKAWDKLPTQPLALFLAGKALIQAGDQQQGTKLVEQAHWVPLGDDRARNEFAAALAQRAFGEDARKENELTMRLGQAGSYYAGDAERRLALEEVGKKDYLKAAGGQEHTILRCLKTYVNFIQSPAYVGVPTVPHRWRARGLLDAGKVEEALKEIAYCRAALPGDVDLAILVVPELERHGHKKEADELFAETAAVYAKISADYPKCAWAHNSIAWLSVCCGRDLDKALEHATKAVELNPESAGHHDTLAEIYFQLGEKDKALAEQKKAVELDPKRSYFAKQLKRIEAGDPKAERPSEQDDD
jgi:tetratricopeptide (TPR) repeat protein